MERDLTYNAPKIKFTDTEGQEEHFYFNRTNNSTNDLTSHDSSSTQLQDANSRRQAPPPPPPHNPFSDNSHENSTESLYQSETRFHQPLLQNDSNNSNSSIGNNRQRIPSQQQQHDTLSLYSASPISTSPLVSNFQSYLDNQDEMTRAKYNQNTNRSSSNYIQHSPTSAGYDRYPLKTQSSIGGSMLRIGLSSSSPSQQQQQHMYDNNSSNRSLYSPDSATDLMVYENGEFSPFGGYPASLFPLSIDEKEPDDYLHNPDPVQDAEYDKNRFLYDLKTMDKKSMNGLIAFIVMFLIAIAIFIILPVFTYTGYNPKAKNFENYEVLTRYLYPRLSAIRTSLIDPDTPEDALFWKSKNGEEWPLVFSDEFNAEGRTFYEGDDQFFTAPDLHYDATKDLEWYDPDAVTTANGTLTLRMDAFKNHGLFYRSGMIQSWNQMCFTQGKLEFLAKLPGYGNITGFWPGLWSMGNLGRPGYLALTEGVWPYTYDSCDAGITPNQSSPDGISYLPGQRLNKCTCPGEAHPNRGVGRGAPEIDALEGEIHGVIGRVSQSLQVAPYDIWYMPNYDFLEIHNSSITLMNTYAGGPFQQAISGVTMLNVTWYEYGDHQHNFQKYGYEYLNDDESGYLRWFVGDNPTFTIYSQALHPNGNVGWRKLPKEPLSLILNFGISNNWAYIDWPSLVFPSTMRVDYVRVYQPKDQINVGCDPTDFPTYDYIQQHLNVYQNVNLTKFEDGGYTFPKHKLIGC